MNCGNTHYLELHQYTALPGVLPVYMVQNGQSRIYLSICCWKMFMILVRNGSMTRLTATQLNAELYLQLPPSIQIINFPADWAATQAAETLKGGKLVYRQKKVDQFLERVLLVQVRVFC